MKCASAKATDKTGTSAADTGTSAADTGTSAADTGTSAATAAGMCSAASAMTTASAASAMTAATSPAAAATGQFYVLGMRGLFAIFLVKRKKRRQAGVEDFLLTEKELMRL
jgi:hypothetical protein